MRHLDRLGYQPDVVIDVGAAHGTPELYRGLPDSRFLLFEPVEECWPSLEAWSATLDATIHRSAAGAATGKVDFFVHDDIEGSSLLSEKDGADFDGERRTVSMIRLDDVDELASASSILLKVDTQGAELSVLDGAADTLSRVDLIVLEAALIPTMNGAPDFAQIVGRLDELGFAVFDLIGGIERPVDSSLAQVDIAAVRTGGPLMPKGGWRRA